MENYFFQTINYHKKKGFDSYSNSTEDIINFYYQKHPELSLEYKETHPLSSSQLFDIVNNDLNDTTNLIAIDTSFEKYIIAFLFAMKHNYNAAERYFLSCINSLDDSFSAKVNETFILLQLAQLSERKLDYGKALQTLKKVYRRIKNDKDLIDKINNFYASCCTSIGLLYYKIYKNKPIAGNLFYKAIYLRTKYKEDYPPLICESYLSIVLRYSAETYYLKKQDKYNAYKTAYSLRSMLLTQTNDEYTKVEFINLSLDFLYFLISESYKIKFINKIGNHLYQCIFLLHKNSLSENNTSIIQSATMLSKYYYIENDYMKFYKWYALLKQLKSSYNLSYKEEFLESEEIYQLLKA